MTHVLVTFIYPDAVKLIDSFIQSINNQTFKNFSIIIFNDGVIDPDKYFKKLNNKYLLVNVKGSIAEIRFEAFRYLKNISADKIIFQDSDDLMTNNRVETCITYLDEYDLVCNDLDIIDTKGEIITTNIWSKRLANNSKFNFEWINKFNIIGLGNTAIKKSILVNEIQYSRTEPLAVDWYIFYQLLEKSKKEGIFVNSCKTIYRQHINNIAGLGDVDEKRLLQALKVKKNHYKALDDIGYDFKKELFRLKQIEEKGIKNIKKNVKQPLFWWEETELIHEKN